jgi:uncharacterized protein (TIGR03067 family)
LHAPAQNDSIRIGFEFIDLPSFAGRSGPREQSKAVTLRGVIMKFPTNRASLRAHVSGLTLILAFALAAGLSPGWTGARARGDDKPQSELLKPFQGTWTSSGEGLDATWTFEVEKVKANVGGMDYTCKVKIDSTAKPFATIDLDIEDGPEEAKGKMSKGIYKLDGEKLTICVSAPGKDRPKEFAPVEDEAYLFELKKQKKE